MDNTWCHYSRYYNRNLKVHPLPAFNDKVLPIFTPPFHLSLASLSLTWIIVKSLPFGPQASGLSPLNSFLHLVRLIEFSIKQHIWWYQYVVSVLSIQYDVSRSPAICLFAFPSPGSKDRSSLKCFLNWLSFWLLIPLIFPGCFSFSLCFLKQELFRPDDFLKPFCST